MEGAADRNWLNNIGARCILKGLSKSGFAMDLPTALQELSTYRVNNTRASQDTLVKGLAVLRGNGLAKMGDESKPL